MSDDLYVICAYDDKSTAEAIHEYLGDFHLYADYNGHIEFMKDWSGKERYCLVLPVSVKHYSTTIEKMTSGATDFLKGYQRGLRSFSRRMEEHFSECTPEMVGEPLDQDAENPRFFVTKVTKAGSITLGPSRPARCQHCRRPIPASRTICRSCEW